MTKFKPITQQELVQAILKQLPEINPLYVKNKLKSNSTQYFDVSDISEWVRHFEKDLYN